MMNKPNYVRWTHLRILSWTMILVYVLLASFPTKKLTSTWGTGSIGTSGMMTGSICRSYHRAPLNLKSLMPAFYRDINKDADKESVYVSNFFWTYLLYAGIMKVFGISEATLRLTAILFTALTAALLGHLLGKKSPITMFAGVLLFVTCPLIPEYGVRPGLIMPIAFCLLIAIWSYGEYVDKKITLSKLWLYFLPLAFSSSFIFPFVMTGIFFAELAQRKRILITIRNCLFLSTTWLPLLAFHLYIIADIYGGLGKFFAHASHRSLASAFAEGYNPILEVARHWGERYGVPLLLLLLTGVHYAIKNHTQNRRQFAVTVAVFTLIIVQTIVLLEMMAVHRFELVMFLPSLCLIAAPTFERMMLPSTEKTGKTLPSKATKAFGIILALSCCVIFIHKMGQWSGPDKYESVLCATFRQAEETMKEKDRGLLIMRENKFSEYLMATYYGRNKFLVALPDNLNSYTPGISGNLYPQNGFTAIVGVKLNNMRQKIEKILGLNKSEVQSNRYIFLWLKDSDKINNKKDMP